jgi:primosomal protein N' (replication factor Y) (superfamily II helicase)
VTVARVADVAFDVPIAHPFSYRIPDHLAIAPGQRVVASLKGGERVGMVVAVHDGDITALKPILRAAEPQPVLSSERLQLARWIADESLSSLGSTCAALLPPPTSEPLPVAPSSAAPPPSSEVPELLVGAGRERRLLERMASAGAVLVIVPDVEAAARWTQRLGKMGEVARLDSGVPEAERAAAWRRFATGAARLAVGTRSALLVPLRSPALLALVDEHEAAHKPPGAPRMHSRDIVLARAATEHAAALLTAATPSVEMWWRARDTATAAMAPPVAGPWPAVTLADTKGILRREPLTPPLARALRETLAAGRRAFLMVSRLASSLACDECGEVVRCPQCKIAIIYSRAAASLTCRVCAATMPVMDTCPSCRGRRLSPFGWGAERVEHAVRRRFPHARVARYDPDAARGKRGEAQRAAAASADVIVGTRGALRMFGRASLGLAGFVSPDQLLRLPDFRAGERMFGLLWAAAERVGGEGMMVIQSQNPEHYAFDAVARQDLDAFYEPELRFRAELGYPPFRRLAGVTVTATAPAEAARLADEVYAAARASTRLTAYPPVADKRPRVRRMVIKGGQDLPAAIEEALAAFRVARPKSRGNMDVEVDPVEWRF